MIYAVIILLFCICILSIALIITAIDLKAKKQLVEDHRIYIASQNKTIKELSNKLQDIKKVLE